MVVYEAARSIVNMKNVTAREIQPAVSMLQIFLGSPKPTLRYAAVKTLSRIATLHPTVVTTCNMDLEGLITDSNRSIATLAITTLLKVHTMHTTHVRYTYCCQADSVYTYSTYVHVVHCALQLVLLTSK